MESVQEVTINSYRHMFVLSYMHLLYLLKLPAPPRAALLLGVCIKIPGTCLFPKNVPEKPSKAECRNSKKKKTFGSNQPALFQVMSSVVLSQLLLNLKDKHPAPFESGSLPVPSSSPNRRSHVPRENSYGWEIWSKNNGCFFHRNSPDGKTSWMFFLPCISGKKSARDPSGSMFPKFSRLRIQDLCETIWWKVWCPPGN